MHIFGTTDGQTTLFGVRQWIASMKWKVHEEWAPYVNIIGSLSGYCESYESGAYTLVTMHGLGHSAVYSSLFTISQMVFNFI